MLTHATFSRFNKTVKMSTWSEQDQKWTVECEDGENFVANFVISGSGALHIPKIPESKGR